MKYAFEMPDGRWHHRDVQEFRNERHARTWAFQCGWTFKGRFLMCADDGGSICRHETQSDNR